MQERADLIRHAGDCGSYIADTGFDTIHNAIDNIRAQENACPASPLIKETALLKPDLMVEVIPLIVVETADFTLFQMVVTPVRMPFMAVDTADFAALKPVVTTDLMPLTTVLTADLMPFQTEVTTDLMPFITVVITDRMAFQTVDTTV